MPSHDPLATAYTSPPSESRRRFLGIAGAGALTVAGGAAFATRDAPASEQTNATLAQTSAETTAPDSARRSVDAAGRTLVVIELAGGNDGLATLVPRNAGTLYDRRPSVHIPDNELVGDDEAYGWHPNLAPLLAFATAAIVGLGTTSAPDGSHFEMERRWWSGQSSGTDLPTTGFLGRLCDQLTEDELVAGLSLGSGATPALMCERAVTLGLNDPSSGWFLNNEDPWLSSLRSGIAHLAKPDPDGSSATTTAARRGLADTLAFADALSEIDSQMVEERYPQSHLGRQLGMAAEIIDQDAGIRVIHMAHGGFDTHTNQRGEHDLLMKDLGDALGTFLGDIDERGRAESTLVCTTSEFGRRVSDNDGGTDHGAAGMAMLCGPVNPGIFGEHPSLTKLDDDNLVATMDFEQYYATIAERWFGLAASEVLEGSPQPIDHVVAWA